MKIKTYNITIPIFISVLLLHSCSAGLGEDFNSNQHYSENSNISDMLEQIENGVFGEIHSLLIQHKDSLVLEKYYHGYTRDSLHACYSITKSITSALLGISIKQGIIQGVNSNVMDNLPAHYSEIVLSDYTRSLTLKNLLTMTAGFQWDDLYDQNAFDEIRKLEASEDWISYILTLPQSYSGDEGFVYNSASAILLSGVIKYRSGISIEKFAQKNLFTPLGITKWQWKSGPQEISNTSSGLYMRPLDLLRFGSLYLHDGRIGDSVIVPAEWVNESTQKRIERGKGSDYGYLWWRYDYRNEILDKLETNDIFFASGYGGQFIWVLPHLDLVVVTTAGNFAEGKIIHQLLKDFIIPSLHQ